MNVAAELGAGLAAFPRAVKLIWRTRALRRLAVIAALVPSALPPPCC